MLVVVMVTRDVELDYPSVENEMDVFIFGCILCTVLVMRFNIV